MPRITLTHFEASVIFALFTSIVLGVVTKKSDPERLHYGLRSFGWFMAATFGLSWLMYLVHG